MLLIKSVGADLSRTPPIHRPRFHCRLRRREQNQTGENSCPSHNNPLDAADTTAPAPSSEPHPSATSPNKKQTKRSRYSYNTESTTSMSPPVTAMPNCVSHPG